MNQPTPVLSWYVTCSLPMHNHPIYNQIMQHIDAILQRIHPDNENKLVEARGMYQGAKDWLEKWPKVLDETINGGLFFLLDTDGFIGRGVHTEVSDILKKGLPVYLVMPDSSFYLITTLTGKAFAEGPDWRMYTFVDVKVLARETEPQDPFDALELEEEIKPEHWTHVHTQLTTPRLEATLQNNMLTLKFSDGATKTLEWTDTEALARFLGDHVGAALPDLDDEPPTS